MAIFLTRFNKIPRQKLFVSITFLCLHIEKNLLPGIDFAHYNFFFPIQTRVILGRIYRSQPVMIITVDYAFFLI